MFFNSYVFFIFFILVLLISRLIFSWPLRKCFLILCSLLFYCAWNPLYGVLIVISVIGNWFLAQNVKGNRRVLILSLVLNLGMLFYFKYGNFFLENVTLFLNKMGFDYKPLEMNILLPVGISFYTFQSMSYVFDVYRDKMKPWFSFSDFALYVTFFPQLVAGPILRAPDFLKQCLEEKKVSVSQINWGISLMIIGLFAKVAVADSFMQPIAALLYDKNLPITFGDAWLGTFSFAIQIFCDFFGYSICAIGIAMCLGFTLPDNFHFPYASLGFSDFWKRWHITLSSWLKDYLYIPLGGNRKGHRRTLINLMITMLLGGLWHGASWMFVIWGGLHGLYLIVERLICASSIGKLDLWKNKFIQIILMLVTFLLVCVTWVFFRAETLESAFEIVRTMFGFGEANIVKQAIGARARQLVLGVTGLTLILHYFLRHSSVEGFFSKIPYGLRSLLLAVMAYAIMISMGGENVAFIYFQF
jgi:alginate O-acetyltransferase complex protein AlgI